MCLVACVTKGRRPEEPRSGWGWKRRGGGGREGYSEKKKKKKITPLVTLAAWCSQPRARSLVVRVEGGGWGVGNVLHYHHGNVLHSRHPRLGVTSCRLDPIYSRREALRGTDGRLEDCGGVTRSRYPSPLSLWPLPARRRGKFSEAANDATQLPRRASGAKKSPARCMTGRG